MKIQVFLGFPVALWTPVDPCGPLDGCCKPKKTFFLPKTLKITQNPKDISKIPKRYGKIQDFLGFPVALWTPVKLKVPLPNRRPDLLKL